MIIGNWIPEWMEIDQGIWYGFGAALKLYWGDELCGFKTREGEAAKNIYLKALSLFQFDVTLLGDDENNCEFMERSKYPR